MGAGALRSMILRTGTGASHFLCLSGRHGVTGTVHLFSLSRRHSVGMGLAVGRGIVIAVPVVADKMHRTAAGVVLAAVAGPVETLAIRHVEVDCGNTGSGSADRSSRLSARGR